MYPLQYKNHLYIPSFISRSQFSLSQIVLKWLDWEKKNFKGLWKFKMERLEQVKKQWLRLSVPFIITCWHSSHWIKILWLYQDSLNTNFFRFFFVELIIYFKVQFLITFHGPNIYESLKLFFTTSMKIVVHKF